MCYVFSSIVIYRNIIFLDGALGKNGGGTEHLKRRAPKSR
jgi:hypothetical protein